VTIESIPPDLLTVDALARLAGTTTRTVRAYQTKGLLPPPRKIGRVAYYGPEHLARLQLIERLLARGFLLSAIGDLLRASEQGAGLAGVLGHPALQRLHSDVPPAPRDPPGPAPEGASTPAVEQAEALREQLASISDRFVDLLRRETWKAAVDEIRASDLRAADEAGGAGSSAASALPKEPGEVLYEAGELQRELADVSDRFVYLLRREAWKAAVTEIREAPES
jgi:DNA-binding transcriptional MerR regulator